MYIYNVTINVDDAIHGEWLEWMKQTHIPDMLDTGKFVSARLCRVLVDEELGGTTYAVQYTCTDSDSLQRYYRDDAEALRKDGITRFGEATVAFRTELEVIDEQIALPEPATAQLFVYGTLMEPQIQKMVFNRVPEQHAAVLPCYMREDNKIAGRYADLNPTEDIRDTTEGIVLLLNKHELLKADHYEGSAYKRIQVILKSGENAWVYVGTSSKNLKS